MTTQWGYDVPRGIIIGSFTITGQLAYDGRPQGSKFYAETEDELIALGNEKVAQLRAEFSGHPCFLYPDDKWELRIYD